MAELVHTAGLLFEQALYDKNVLPPQEEARFIESIKMFLEQVKL